MEKKTQGALTEGPILRVLMKLAMPIMASAFLSTAYSITDMAWIGKLGAKAVAGVGVGGMFVWLSGGLSTLARMGGQVYVGQNLGKGDRGRAGEYALGAIQLTLLFGLLYGFICFTFTNPLVDFFELTDPETISYARIYLKITCGLIIFSYINMVLTGLYTAQGDSATPLKVNVIGLVMNMIFDPILIFGVGPFPELGVVGAAVATVASQVVVTIGLLAVIFLSRKKENILREISYRKLADKKIFVDIVKLGGPTALQSTLYCAISMVLTRMIAGFGEAAVATQKLGGQIESISWNTADGFAAAMNAFAAQNFGAGNIDRVKKGYRISAITMILWGTLIGLFFIVFPEQISGFFFHEAHVIPVAVSYFIIIGICEPFMCVELMAIGAMSGLGNTKTCSIISIILTGMRIPMAYLFTRTSLGLDGVWWALTISSVAKGICLHFAFQHQCKKSAAALEGGK